MSLLQPFLWKKSKILPSIPTNLIIYHIRNLSNHIVYILLFLVKIWSYLNKYSVATPLLEECEDDTHTPKMGTWESRRTLKTLELNCRGQNTSHYGVIYIIGKLWKCKCRKWAFMGHLDICNTSCVQTKGRESNWQFDSRPLKVGNRPDLGVCRGSATHRWKALKESYKFASDLVPIRGLSKELWPHEVPGIQFGTISGLHLGSPGTKRPFGCRCSEITQRILHEGRWWLPPSPGRGELNESMLPVACPNTKSVSKSVLTNLLVDFWCRIE